MQKVIWGVEAFTDEKTLQNKTAQVLSAVLKKTNAEVAPVYVLSPDQLRLPIEVFTDSCEMPQYVENFEEHSRDVAGAVEKELREWLGGLDVPRMTAPRLLIQDEYSLRTSVASLTRFAQDEGADWIAVSTHARHGVSRFLLGSFAETLIYGSPLPVLVVGPDTQNLTDLKHIIFPTDFTPASRQCFEHTVALAKDLDVDLILFHKIVYLTRYLSPFFQDAEDLDHQMRNAEVRKEEAERWAEWAREKGVTANVVINDRQEGDVAESLLERAQHTPGAMIVMLSQTGPVASAILGSVTRDVVRHASCPLLVVHPGGPTTSLH